MTSDVQPDAIEPGQAVAVDWDANRYHASTSITSRSMLEDLRKSPALFYRRWVSREAIERVSTDAQSLGTKLHIAVLEPEQWATRVIPSQPPRPPGANGRARKGTPERAAFEAWKRSKLWWRKAVHDSSLMTDEEMVCWLRVVAELGNPIVVTDSERARIEAAAASVRSHEGVAMLLASKGRSEQTVLWREPETEELMRVRYDRITELPDGSIAVLDLKGTHDPSPHAFSSSIHRYGYHRQAAIYYDAASALYPDRDILYAFAVVRTDEPFEPALYEIEDEALEIGRAEYRESLDELLRRRMSGDWTAAWQNGCIPINLPRYAIKRSP